MLKPPISLHGVYITLIGPRTFTTFLNTLKRKTGADTFNEEDLLLLAAVFSHFHYSTDWDSRKTLKFRAWEDTAEGFVTQSCFRTLDERPLLRRTFSTVLLYAAVDFQVYRAFPVVFAGHACTYSHMLMVEVDTERPHIVQLVINPMW